MSRDLSIFGAYYISDYIRGYIGEYEDDLEIGHVNAGLNSLLHLAAKIGHVGCITILLNSGADINSCDKDGRTPLHSTAELGHIGAVSLLLKKGANPNLFDNHGHTPISLGIRHSDIVEKLVVYDANYKNIFKAKDIFDAITLYSNISTEDMERFEVAVARGLKSRTELKQKAGRIVSEIMVKCPDEVGMDIAEFLSWREINWKLSLLCKDSYEIFHAEEHAHGGGEVVSAVAEEVTETEIVGVTYPTASDTNY